MTASRGAGARCGGNGGLNRIFSYFRAGCWGGLHLSRPHFASSSRSRASSSRANGGKALECARFLDRAAGISKSAAECLVSTSLPNGASPPSRDPGANTVADRETKPDQDSCVRQHRCIHEPPSPICRCDDAGAVRQSDLITALPPRPQ
jgi:hypothetical protein